MATVQPSRAACDLDLQGTGRVAEVIDPRTIRLDDGREVRLIGIEPPATSYRNDSLAWLRRLLPGAQVTLHADSDTPDRYGRQPAFVFIYGEDEPIQSRLLAQGLAFAAGDVAEADCAAGLAAAETAARTGKRGIWADPSAIKKAENPAAILAEIGRFIIVEGKVVSARQAGATFYINFSKRWIQGFAVTISRRMMPSFSAAGLDPVALTNRRIRVRGFVTRRSGPRIEAFRPGQIELIGDSGPTATTRGK